MERARQERIASSAAVNHPLNFNPGIIKGGDWASSVPAWCDVDCRIGILPGWKIADAQAEIVACVEKAAKAHPFLAENPPEVVWSGFLSPGFELSGAEESEAVLAAAYGARLWGHAGGQRLHRPHRYPLLRPRLRHPGAVLRRQAEAIHGFNERVELELPEEGHQDPGPVHRRLVRRRGGVTASGSGGSKGMLPFKTSLPKRRRPACPRGTSRTDRPTPL